MSQKKVELVAGAGDWASLRAAADAGADSVYFGLKNFNLRSHALNFDFLELKKVADFLHRKKKKAYLVLNSLIYQPELKKLKIYLGEAKKARVDAVIAWDMAVVVLAREHGLKVHLSTQASVANLIALQFYQSQGVERVILARECRLHQIKEIAAKIEKEKINCQLEAFVHGAMCVSISGRCFLSELSFLKSANRGSCLQVCRRNFKITDTQDNQDYLLGQDYILSAKDLCALDFVDRLISAGVKAFKVEGRRRSSEYNRIVVSAYREAIDAFYQGSLSRSLKEKLKIKLKKVYNRGFSSGFYFGRPEAWQGRELESGYEKIYLGEVLKFYRAIKVAEIQLKGGSQGPKLKRGQVLLFTGKNSGPNFIKAEQIQINHCFVDLVMPGEKCGIKLNFKAYPKDKIFIWQKKSSKIPEKKFDTGHKKGQIKVEES